MCSFERNAFEEIQDYAVRTAEVVHAFYLFVEH